MKLTIQPAALEALLPAVHRALLCAFAIGCLWSSSLSAARYLTALSVPRISFESVVSDCHRTYDEVIRQQRTHVACIERSLRKRPPRGAILMHLASRAVRSPLQMHAIRCWELRKKRRLSAHSAPLKQMRLSSLARIGPLCTLTVAQPFSCRGRQQGYRRNCDPNSTSHAG